MSHDRTTIWQGLLEHALAILDSAAPKAGSSLQNWTLGGGTMLMRRYRHRMSKDVDVFLPDAQGLGFLSPRLNEVANEKTSDYVEQAGFVKLYFPEGEVDFVAAAPLTLSSSTVETILGRPVRVETTAEIIGKKVEYRAAQFKARDIFDVACVLERDQAALLPIEDVLVLHKAALVSYIARRDQQLREDFAAIDVLDYRPAYDEAVAQFLEYLDCLQSSLSR